MSNFDSIESLLEDNLKDIYSAEKQLTKALPKMAKAANSAALKNAMEAHLEETEGQIARLEQIAKIMDIKLSGKKCKAMEGLIEEGSEAMEAEGVEELVDANMVIAAQKVEHYEIAAYGSCVTLAEQVGLKDVAKLLKENLKEEEATDKKLTQLCEGELLSQFEGESEDESKSISR